jgi:kynureninase
MPDRFEDLAHAAESLDAADPLAGYRARFHLPDGLIYLDGHSLGPLPQPTAGRLAATVTDDWGERLIAGWNEAGWIDLPETVGAAIAPLVGALPDELVACDSVSVNLFKLGHAALRLAGGRRIVLAEANDFPTDAQVLEGLCALHGATLLRMPRAQVRARLGPDVALLALSHVHYRTAAMWDLAAASAAARDAGALTLWDLSHSTGAVELDLGAAGADFAVGCGYKYLNGGPGAPAFAFVARRHHSRLETPIRGWMGHAAPFAFEDHYRPAPGVRRLLAGTPPILSLAALHAGAALAAEAGPARLAAKARALVRLFRAGVEAIGDPDLSIETPTHGHGAHLTIRHRHAWGLVRALAEAGVVGDYRAPEAARFGFSPMIVRHAEAVAAARALAEVLKVRRWDDPRFAARPAVT